MANTGVKSFTTAVNDTGMGTLSWNTPTLALSNDSSKVSATGSGTTNYLKVTGVSGITTIPDGAIIKGIIVTIWKDNQGNGSPASKDNTVKLVVNGNIVGNNKASAVAWTNTQTDYAVNYGSATDAWGLNLTGADVKQANFGVALSVDVIGGTPVFAEVDYISIDIYYSGSGCWESPAVGANVTGVGSATWGTPNNAIASDNAYATLYSSFPVQSNYLQVSGFDFSHISDDAVINGILVEIERKSTAGGTINDAVIKMVVAGSVVGDNKSTGAAWNATEGYVSFGSSVDSWGLTLTGGDVKSANFGVAISANIVAPYNTYSVDHVRLTLYYEYGDSYVQDVIFIY